MFLFATPYDHVRVHATLLLHADQPTCSARVTDDLRSRWNSANHELAVTSSLRRSTVAACAFVHHHTFASHTNVCVCMIAWRRRSTVAARAFVHHHTFVSHTNVRYVYQCMYDGSANHALAATSSHKASDVAACACHPVEIHSCARDVQKADAA